MSKKIYVCEYMSNLAGSSSKESIETTDVAQFISGVKELTEQWYIDEESIKTYVGELKEIPIDRVLNPIVVEP